MIENTISVGNIINAILTITLIYVILKQRK